MNSNEHTLLDLCKMYVSAEIFAPDKKKFKKELIECISEKAGFSYFGVKKMLIDIDKKIGLNIEDIKDFDGSIINKYGKKLFNYFVEMKKEQIVSDLEIVEFMTPEMDVDTILNEWKEKMLKE